MKQVKFFLVALMAAVMGVSVSSCMNSEDNGPQTVSVIAKLESLSSSFKTMDGTKWIPTDATSIMLLDPGMYIINGQYNHEDVNVNTASITFTLTSTPVKIDGSISSIEQTPDITMYALEYQNLYPIMFDKYTLIIPAMIWSKGSTNAEVAKDAEKHSLMVTYDEIVEGATELVLHLNDVVSEDKDAKRDVLTVKYQSYNLAQVISEFGGNLKKITIKAKVNSSSCDLENTNTKDGSFSIDYSTYINKN